jgi:hypothetical protein
MTSFGFASYFNKKVNNVWVTVECIDLPKPLQTNNFIQLTLSDNLLKVRQILEEKNIIDSTLSFVKKYSENGDSKIAEIAFEDEESMRLSEIVRKTDDTHILNLTTCSKFKWKNLNQKHKLDYGCIMTSDGIKKADKRAFEMKNCILEETGNIECKVEEFKSKSSEDLMMDKNLFCNVDINVQYFLKLGMAIGTLNNKKFHVETNYSYHFIKYGKALLKLNFEHLEATQEFKEEVEKAINSEDPAEQFKQIIKDFGQFIPTEVILGGRVHYDDFAKTVKHTLEKSSEISGKIKVEDIKIKMEEASTNSEEKQKDYSRKYTKIIGGEQPDDIKNLDIVNWTSSLNNHKYWDCIEFRNPISIFQFLSEDLRKRVVKSVGMKIYYSTINDLNLEDVKKPIEFKLNGLSEVKTIIRNKDIDYKIFATVTDMTKTKNEFFTCQVLCPSDGRLPSLIIHRVQNPFKFFKKRECKLKVGWMVIGYYEDFNFDFSTRLNILENDFNASDAVNPIKYDSEEPICLGVPVLSEYPKTGSPIIGYYYHVQEENNEYNKIKACTFAYCLKDKCLVDLPKFTFYTLVITNYHNHRACNTISLEKSKYNNFNTTTPKFISIYSTVQTSCVFLKQRNGQVKIKKIGKDNKTKFSVKCAIFDPYQVFCFYIYIIFFMIILMISNFFLFNKGGKEPIRKYDRICRV